MFKQFSLLLFLNCTSTDKKTIHSKSTVGGRFNNQSHVIYLLLNSLFQWFCFSISKNNRLLLWTLHIILWKRTRFSSWNRNTETCQMICLHLPRISIEFCNGMPLMLLRFAVLWWIPMVITVVVWGFACYAMHTVLLCNFSNLSLLYSLMCFNSHKKYKS